MDRVQDREAQFVLVAEVRVDGALREAGRVGDLLQ